MASTAEEFGPYLVYEQLGLGGMASVHRAETRGVEGFRRSVALKRMLPSVAGNPELVQSFIREARLASYLRHSNVAQTYDLGKVDGTYFIAMELVPGRNLREILRQCARVCGPMPLPLVLEICNQICDALDYAHGLCDESGQPLGIVHRDVSPSNIIVSEGGVVKLIDFGIAKATAGGMQTMSGTIKGKFTYMAPEYLGGRIDARADLFALGVITHELLANRPLFQGADDMDTLMNLKSMPVPLPSLFRPDLPRELDSIVMTALERDPDRRWQRASALRTALGSEIKRLGMGVMNHQIADWVEWAFRQRKEDSEPDISVEMATASIAVGSVSNQTPPALVSPPPSQSSKMKTVIGVGRATPRPSASPPTRPSASPVATAHRSATQPVVKPAIGGIGVAIIVLLAACITGAVVYFALPFFT